MISRPSTRPLSWRIASAASAAEPCTPVSSRCRPRRRAAWSMPRMISEKNSPCRSGSSTPMVCVRPVDRLRAALSGTYRSCSMIDRMRARVDSVTLPWPLMTLDTVAVDTCASRATSLSVAANPWPPTCNRLHCRCKRLLFSCAKGTTATGRSVKRQSEGVGMNTPYRGAGTPRANDYSAAVGKTRPMPQRTTPPSPARTR